MMDTANKDTITAISTPVGEGGIGIVRMSGPSAIALAERIFVPVKDGKLSCSESHTVHYGYIKSPGTGEVVDEVLLTVLRSPNTYTAEDMVEINCHGGIMPLKKVLEVCICSGARLAEPGEFTRKAFLNGRIDLAQAEAVLDIIKAKTDVSRRVALRQLRGAFSDRIGTLRGSIMDILAEIELTIDFSQEDVEFPEVGRITEKVRKVHSSLKEVLDTCDKGMILREGASVVICGKPNVGKSSLMNALLRHDRVIVTPVAGTTRDVIEESINLSGVSVKLSDTAGIIETRDRVEIEGIKRSREKLADADVVLFMVDSSRVLSEKDRQIHQMIKGGRTVVVANKTDLPKKLDLKELKKLSGDEEVIEVSALKKEGLETLEDAIAKKLFKGDTGIPEGAVVTNARHKEALLAASDALERAALVTGDKYNGELLASDLNEAVRQLGLVTGETVTDDILDRIFSQFCIGK